MYEAVTGTARPTTQTISEVQSAVQNSEPPARSMTMDENFSARPVLVVTPTMMPAQAQVAATPSAWMAPLARAGKSFRRQSAVSVRRKLTPMASRIDQNTA